MQIRHFFWRSIVISEMGVVAQWKIHSNFSIQKLSKVEGEQKKSGQTVLSLEAIS